MAEYKKIDQTLRDTKDLLDYLTGEIEKHLSKNPEDVSLHDKKQNLELFTQLYEQANKLNELHAKRCVRIIDFVEVMRGSVLEEGDSLPSDLLEVQINEFTKTFKPLAEDYDQIKEDYYA